MEKEAVWNIRVVPVWDDTPVVLHTEESVLDPVVILSVAQNCFLEPRKQHRWTPSSAFEPLIEHEYEGRDEPADDARPPPSGAGAGVNQDPSLQPQTPPQSHQRSQTEPAVPPFKAAAGTRHRRTRSIHAVPAGWDACLSTLAEGAFVETESCSLEIEAGPTRHSLRCRIDCSMPLGTACQLC